MMTARIDQAHSMIVLGLGREVLPCVLTLRLTFFDIDAVK